MTLPELLVMSIGGSVVVATAGLLIMRGVEHHLSDPALRERAWAAVLHLPVLPPLIIGLLALTPAPVLQIQAPASMSEPVLQGSPAAAGVLDGASIGMGEAAVAVLVLAALMAGARALRLTVRTVRLRRLMRATTPAPSELRRLVDETARRIGVAAPNVRVCPVGAEALLSGLRKPVLVMPAGLAATPDHPATRAICAHELSHLRRGDHRALWAEELLLTLLAINPLLRVIRRYRGAAREEACDAMALVGSDADTRRLYARALLAALRRPLGQDHVPALTFTSPKRTFAMLRLKAILAPASSAGPRLRLGAAGLGALIAAGVCTGSVALAAQREPVIEVLRAVAAQPVPAPAPQAAVRPAAVRPVAAALGAAPVALAPLADLAPTPTPAPAPAPAAEAAPSPDIIRNPSWVQHPVPRFPAEAVTNGVTSGRVVLTCTAEPEGRLSGCAATSETPAGNGFAAAAIAAAGAARLSPRTVDEAAPRASVTFSVVFRIPDPA